MKRVKRHKIKKEKAESSSSHVREHEEHDLAYFIHDRVELMHQVFSLLKYKELKAMAPECVRNLAIGDLQELCTEELLGISSKRLLAVLDGAEPPSDTESSSPSPPPDELETISLDSISSDEELLNTSHKKKKHKHRSHRSSKKKVKPKEPEADENAELSKASRAGLTVLELLELQARARAIRAQLQQEQLHKNVQETTTVDSSHHSSDNEVEIKEEPADVVEISSEDEKPDVNQLNNKMADPPPSPKYTAAVTVNPKEGQPSKDKERNIDENPTTVTKRINDLIITVPQTKSSRKIKLNRNKVSVSVPNDIQNTEKFPASISETPNRIVVEKPVTKKVINIPINTPEKKDGKPKKKKKDKKKKSLDKDGSDHDEITLQLSDSEKMDLFENLDESRKNYDKVSSSSEDSESSSDESDGENATDDDSVKNSNMNDTTTGRVVEKDITGKPSSPKAKDSEKNCNDIEISDRTVETNSVQNTSNSPTIQESNAVDKDPMGDVHTNTDLVTPTQQDITVPNEQNSLDVDINSKPDCIQNEIITPDQTPVDETNIAESENPSATNNVRDSTEKNIPKESNDKTNTSSEITEVNLSEKELHTISKDNSSCDPKPDEEKIEIRTIDDIPVVDTMPDAISNLCQKDDTNVEASATEKSVSDGEISDRESSEVEAMDVRPEVVCISDEDGPKKKDKKKKKKKEKKSKKSKKSKSDFREDADQNFYKDNTEILERDKDNGNMPIGHEITETIDLDSDEVCEIFELSDDSSGSDIECTLLSKEPTAEEIEALSAKIDEIKREEVVTDQQIQEHERMLAEKEKHIHSDENVEHVSWRDRYLDSTKVKKVLTTANIFNALRKKNKELKKKIEDSKKKNEDEVTEDENMKVINTELTKEIIPEPLEEGSIEQYNTLQGSTKYVDPVKEPVTENVETNDPESEKSVQENATTITEGKNVTNEMKKDAKQLLKMYRRLLKYNDIKKPTDPNKKKKKKQKKKEKQEKLKNTQVAL